jgi:biotin carboxyl carrier protein
VSRYMVTVDNREYEIELEYQSENYLANVNGHPCQIVYSRLGEGRFLMLVNRESIEADVRPGAGNGDRIVFMMGFEIPVMVENYQLAQARKAAGINTHAPTEQQLYAPMPGMVLKVNVVPGQHVDKGETLVVIEAMKMENIIKARADAVVSAVHAVAGRSIEKGDSLLEFHADAH